MPGGDAGRKGTPMSTSLGGPARSDSVAARTEQFLDLVAEGRNGKAAAAAAGFAWRAMCRRRAAEARLRRDWDAAEAMARRLLDSVLLDHVINGVPVRAKLGSGVAEDAIEFRDALAATVTRRLDTGHDGVPAVDPPAHPVTVETARQIIRERAAAQDARAARLAAPTAFRGDLQDGAFKGGQAP